jgi:hypothetical protein
VCACSTQCAPRHTSARTSCSDDYDSRTAAARGHNNAHVQHQSPQSRLRSHVLPSRRPTHRALGEHTIHKCTRDTYKQQRATSTATHDTTYPESITVGCVVCVCVRCATHHSRQHSDTATHTTTHRSRVGASRGEHSVNALLLDVATQARRESSRDAHAGGEAGEELPTPKCH